MGDNKVLPFSRSGDPIERLDAVIARPPANADVGRYLSLYREAIDTSPLVPDTLAQLAELFSNAGTIRIAVKRRGSKRGVPPIALEDMCLVGCDRVFLTVRARDPRLQAKLIHLGFGRDGVSVEDHPRVLYSRSSVFVF